MGADGQTVPQRYRIAQIHQRIDGGHTLALGNPGEQGFDGTGVFVGVLSQGTEGLPIGQDLRGFLEGNAGKGSLTVGDCLGQTGGNGCVSLRRGDSIQHSYHTEAGSGELFKYSRGDGKLHGVTLLCLESRAGNPRQQTALLYTHPKILSIKPPAAGAILWRPLIAVWDRQTPPAPAQFCCPDCVHQSKAPAQPKSRIEKRRQSHPARRLYGKRII